MLSFLLPMSYAMLARSLQENLALTQPPVAICLSEERPAGVAGYEGQAPAGCQFWQEAAKRVFTTAPQDHAMCAIGMLTHNLEGTAESDADQALAMKVFSDLGYVRNEDLPFIPMLPKRPKYVTYGPLGETPGAPDVVMLFVKANQTLILSEAAQQVEAGLPPAMGRPACAVVSQAVVSGRSALSLGCCGARAYLDILTDDVALYAIPGDKLEAYVERIQALSKANAILTKFHQIRRHDVEAGKHPTVQQSLEALQAQS